LRSLSLRTELFTQFSVPHAVCIAGEFQYIAGQASLVTAVNLRLEAAVDETDGEFVLQTLPPAATEEVAAAWTRLLRARAAPAPVDIDGLTVTLSYDDALAAACTPEDMLRTPAAAVALVCAVQSHRGSGGESSAESVASTAAEMLAELMGCSAAHRRRFYALALACVLGGAWFAAPAAEPLNAQLLISPDSLILVLCQHAARRGAAQWENVLSDALLALGSGSIPVAFEDDMGAFFEQASRKLTEEQTVVLYGLLRMNEMLRGHIETLDRQMRDHDCLAEMLDEESAVLGDYFGFPGEHLKEVRDAAVESGALGAKTTYAFGDRPALVILAPGRRAEVAADLRRHFPDDVIVPVDVEPDGVR
jgi:mevalonate kinase